MTHIAFFGHDAADAAIRRRVQAFQDDHLTVTGYMMHRRAPGELAWENVDLGETRDGAFLQRIKSIFSGASLAAKDAERLRTADLIYARNLDMLALAFLTKRKLKLKTPVVSIPRIWLKTVSQRAQIMAQDQPLAAPLTARRFRSAGLGYYDANAPSICSQPLRTRWAIRCIFTCTAFRLEPRSRRLSLSSKRARI